MKRISVSILEPYKSYQKDTTYEFEGDLIILSGINGSGKSQLLRIIAKNGKDYINRNLTQYDDVGNCFELENIQLLSFKNSINLGEDFGQFSVTFQKAYAAKAWDFYNQNIQHIRGHFNNTNKTKRFNDGTLIFDNNGLKRSSWRSINNLIEILKSNFDKDKVFDLSKSEFESVLPTGFIWRDEDDIIQQVGNLFYIACCDRANKQIECSATTEIFDNAKWLETAPWTILNQLFEELCFKYRFKSDYSFKTPSMEENPKLREGNDIRALADLSDGEKAILKLALISLDEEISKDFKLVLFDEYDAPLNPSLTEAFYHVIEEFYIKKGIQVIITTHSPATISLAPEYAQFYEVFPQEESSPKIVKVSQYDYEELKKANKSFYEKIKNQEDRILELEKVNNMSGKMLFVEDQYDQLYKIAYLKVKGVDGITEENFEELFEKHSCFSIHGNFASGGLYNRMIESNVSSGEHDTIICLFDFDNEGYLKFESLTNKKNNTEKIFSHKQGSVRDSLFIKHLQANRYAMMLPIPERLEVYVSEKTSSDCFIEVESLLSEEYLKANSKAEIRSQVLQFYKMKDKRKKDFWKDLIDVDPIHFKDFKPLFKQIETIFAGDELSKSDSQKTMK